MQPTQNDGVAKVGTDQTDDDCVKDCKLKKLAKQGKAGNPKIHHVQSMHKGAPSHRTPHNKGPRNRKNMPGPGLPTPPVQGEQSLLQIMLAFDTILGRMLALLWFTEPSLSM